MDVVRTTGVCRYAAGLTNIAAVTFRFHHAHYSVTSNNSQYRYEIKKGGGIAPPQIIVSSIKVSSTR